MNSGEKEDLPALSDERINDFRSKIDDIDETILDLINERLGYALEIGRAKAQKGAQVLDNTRETRLLNRLSELNQGPLSDHMLKMIYKQIILSSKELQKEHRATYLGPEATFTHIAAIKHFGQTVSYIPKSSIRDVFAEVEKRACRYGVVPVENSIEGSVNHTLDLFPESSLKICAEKYLSVSHDLLSVSGSLNDIQMIYSHPQAFAQCRQWIMKYLPKAEFIECSSTAEAAKRTLEDKSAAAIASTEAAEIYRLQPVSSRIEDVVRNTTRFLVISKQDSPPTGADKTSVMFVTSHMPGALYKALQPIAEAQINMLKLESRPARHENWNYFFFVDVEGHRKEEKIRTMIKDMGKVCIHLKCLGSYPWSKEGFDNIQN